MKVLLIADIHSNMYALRAIEAAEAPFDLVLCAGDIVDWGMNPKEALDWLRRHKFAAVSGNHEMLLLSSHDNAKRVEAGLEPVEGTYYTPSEPLGEESNFTTYTLNRLDEADIAFIRNLPESAVVEADGYTYYIKHAARYKKPDAVLEAMLGYRSQPQFDELWAETGRPDVRPEKRRIVFAHTHQCWMHLVRGGGLYMNPGSVSNRTLGEDNIEPGADYIVIQDGVPRMKHVSYPTDQLRQRIEEASFDDIRRTLALQLHTPEKPNEKRD